YRDDQLFLMENGRGLRIQNGKVEYAEPVPAGRLLIEEGVEGGVPEYVIHDRRQIAQEGMMVVLITVRAQTGELVEDPQFVVRGFEWQNEIQPELARSTIHEIIGKMLPAEASDYDNVREEVVVAMRKFCKKHLSRRPLIVPIVTEV
ncbi:MAG: hypothetical protein SNJ72_07035, partial [Fimbriimonadales bacterium]